MYINVGDIEATLDFYYNKDKIVKSIKESDKYSESQMKKKNRRSF